MSNLNDEKDWIFFGWKEKGWIKQHIDWYSDISTRNYTKGSESDIQVAMVIKPADRWNTKEKGCNSRE